MQKLKTDHIQRLREGFGDHPFFLYAQSAFNALHPLCGEDLLFFEHDAQLFYSASLLIDQITSQPALITESLWTDLRADYHKAVQLSNDSINVEIAMLLYVVAYTIEGVPGIKDSSKMTGDILRLIRKRLNDTTNVLQFSSTLNKVTDKHNEALSGWLDNYTSGPTLTQQIEDVLKPRKAEKQTMPKADPPNTLDYINMDIKDKTKRIDCLRRAWEFFKWIEKGTNVRDFERFFEYSEQPYDCHINWTAQTNVLCLLLSRLLGSGLFTKHYKCTIKHIVKSQFQKVYNSRFNTIDGLTRKRIELCIAILNPQNPLPTNQQSIFHEDNDDNSMTLGDIMANNMSIRKK